VGNPNDVAASFHPPYPEMKRIITETTAVWVTETRLTAADLPLRRRPELGMIQGWC
jgi:hypothetical protein